MELFNEKILIYLFSSPNHLRLSAIKWRFLQEGHLTMTTPFVYACLEKCFVDRV